MTEDQNKETKSYLARIRNTIEASNRLVEEVSLRIAETDRMLEKQGLTREQVMAMRFSDAQIEAANEELRRRGMDPLEKWSSAGVPDLPQSDPRPSDFRNSALELPSADAVPDVELAERQRKFGMMMKPFQI